MLKEKISKKIIAVFLIIVVFGGFLRMHKLGMQSFIADEYLGIKIAVGKHKTGEWKHWDFNTNKLGEEEYTRAQVYYWQVAKLFDFLPTSEATARLISVGWGMVAIITVFLATFLITRNWTIALIACFLSAISITELIYDRKLRMYAMFAPVYLWFSFAVFRFLEYRESLQAPFFEKLFKRKGKQKRDGFVTQISQKSGLDWNWFLPALLLGFLSFKTHDLTVNILPTILVYLLVMGIFLLIYKRQHKNRYLITIALFLMTGIVLLVGLPLVKTVPVVGYILEKIDGSFKEIGWVFHWTYLQKITLDYSYILLGLLFIIVGGYTMLKRYGKLGLWTVLSFLVPLILAIFTWKRNVGTQYIYLTQLFKVIIVACGVYFISQRIASTFKNSQKAFKAVLGAVLLLLINLAFFSSDLGFYQSVKSWGHSNYREAFEYFLKKKSEDAALIARPLTNYYLKGNNVKLLAYSDDNKMTLKRVLEAQEEYNEVWVIFAQKLNITGDARRFIQKEFNLIETPYTNKKVKIYVWRKKISG